MSDVIIIHTDGGCRGNGKEDNLGSWAVVMEYKDKKKELYSAELNVTNNKMELLAIIKAMEAVKNKTLPVKIYSDSAYAVNGINQWMKGWKKRGWKKPDKKTPENVEMWKELDRLIQLFDDIEVIKVKGHSTNYGNNRADELVNIAMDYYEANLENEK